MIVLSAPRLGFFGGVERHVFDLATGLRARGHRVALLHGPESARDVDRFRTAFDLVRPQHAPADALRQAEVVYLHKPADARTAEELARTRRVLIAIHDHDQTCVRSHRYLPVTHEPCARCPGLTCAAHGCVVVRDPIARFGAAVRNPFRLLAETRQLARAGRLIAGSAYLRTTLVDLGIPPERVSVVHPVPPESQTPATPPPAAPVVAFVGQIIRGKGLDVLLHALVKIPAATLLVAGDGSGRLAATRLARKLGIARRVEFLGPLPPAQVEAVYDACRVLAVPSRWPEPFGMVGIEAMRRARPVVAAWHGGIPEWLQHAETGMGFRPGDADDLAHGLRTVLFAPGYATMADTAARVSSERFSFAAMLDQIESVLGLERNHDPSRTQAPLARSSGPSGASSGD